MSEFFPEASCRRGSLTPNDANWLTPPPPPPPPAAIASFFFASNPTLISTFTAAAADNGDPPDPTLRSSDPPSLPQPSDTPLQHGSQDGNLPRGKDPFREVTPYSHQHPLRPHPSRALPAETAASDSPRSGVEVASDPEGRFVWALGRGQRLFRAGGGPAARFVAEESIAGVMINKTGAAM